MTAFNVEENWIPHNKLNDTASYNKSALYLLNSDAMRAAKGKFNTLTAPPIRFEYILFCILKENFSSSYWGNLRENQQEDVVSDVSKCVDCLYALDEYKKSMLSDTDLQKAFPNIKADDSESSSLSPRSNGSMFSPAPLLPSLLKNYKEAIEGFHLESTKFACELITSHRGHHFKQKIKALSELIDKVAEYQKNPNDEKILLALTIEVNKFNKYIDSTDPLSTWCRKLIGYGLILLGTIFPGLTQHGEEVLKPQFMHTKDALKKLVDAVQEAVDTNSGNLTTIHSSKT